jgi:tetratricopeptide (TPR) repeat protein
MAVHRTRPLQHDPISGKRLRQGALLLSALIAFCGLGFHTSARAQEGGLSGGAASYAAGKYETAIRQMTSVLQGDKVSATEAAKALYFRGLAYQKLGQSTRAIADLGAAVWLGLSPSERTAALVNRSLAYRAAGLKTEADAELASARKEDNSDQVDKLIASNGSAGAETETASVNAFSTEVRSEGGHSTTIASAAPPARNAEAANPGSWATTQGEPPASEPSGSNRLSRWWASVRGPSSESAPAPAPSAPPSQPSPKPPAVTTAWTTQTQASAPLGEPSSKPPAVATAWTTQTQASAEGTRVATASPTVPVPSASGGNYRLQLSPTRSEAEAQGLWQKVVKQNQQLAELEPRIEKTDMGDLGTFYRLQIGPFPDKAETLKLCNALKRSGVDCFLVNP